MSCSLLRDVVVIYSSASGIAMAAHDVTKPKRHLNACLRHRQFDKMAVFDTLEMRTGWA